MLRLAILALVACALLPARVHAQSAPATGQGFGFCTVTDTSRAQAVIWASPVFPVEYTHEDPGGFLRGEEVAGEFLAHVGTLGGRGNKSCVVLASQGEAATFRDEQRAGWDKRVYFIKIGDWREVAWTPAPRKPAQAASTAPVTRHFLCQATQTNLPDRSDLSRTVASSVFTMPVPAVDTLKAMHDQATAYTTEFQSVVQAHGLPVQGSCMPYDTAGEAQYAYQQLVRHSKGFNMKYTEVAWTPSGRAAATAVSVPAALPSRSSPASAHAPPSAANSAPDLGIHYLDSVTPDLQRTLALPSAQGVFVAAAAPESPFRHMDVLLEIAGQAVNAPAEVAATFGRLRPGFQAPVRVWRDKRLQEFVVVVPVPAQATAPALPARPREAGNGATRADAPDAAPPSPATAAQGQYCVAFASRSKPVLQLRTPLWEDDARPADLAAMAASTARLVAALKQAHPGDWDDLPAAKCYPNSAVIAGESFCFAIKIKRFGGDSHTAGMYCNVSRAGAEERIADMKKAEGPDALIFDWPGKPVSSD